MKKSVISLMLHFRIVGLALILASCASPDDKLNSATNASTTNSAVNNTSTTNSASNNTSNATTNGGPCNLAADGVLVTCRGADPMPSECDCAAGIVDLAALDDSSCEIERICGELIGVDCGAAVDGPYIYYDASGTAVEQCGGACWVTGEGFCEECPPVSRGWTCGTF